MQGFISQLLVELPRTVKYQNGVEFNFLISQHHYLHDHLDQHNHLPDHHDQHHHLPDHPDQHHHPEIIKSWSAMRNPHRPQSLFLPADLPDLPLICHICQLICQICHWSARSANYLPIICQICHWSSRSTTDLPDLPMICQWSARSNKEMPEFFFWGGVICQNVITSRLFSNFTPHHQGLPTYHPKTLICQKKNWGEKNHLCNINLPKRRLILLGGI